MPNYCDYIMKVVGKRADCRTFMTKLMSYAVPDHFWRIFEANAQDEENTEGTVSLYVSGYCAWSLESCCRASGYSKGIDLFDVNTRNLNLKMEAYSHEPGMGFEEHFIYDHGMCVKDECVDMSEFYWDKSEFPTYEDFLVEFPGAPPENSFEDGVSVLGGFGDSYGEWHI